MSFIQSLRKFLPSFNNAQLRGTADIFSSFSVVSLLAMFWMISKENSDWLLQGLLLVTSFLCFFISHKLRGYIK